MAKITIVESQGDGEMNNGQLALVGRLDNAVRELGQKEAEFAAYLDELNERREQIQNLKSQLYDHMSKTGVKKLESQHLVITAVAPTTRHSIDTKAFAAQRPELFAQIDAQFGKNTDVDGYVKIKVREEK